MWKLRFWGEPKGESKGSSSADERLVERLETLEADLEGIRLEWATYYKKLSRLAGHITKTAALDAPAQPIDNKRTIDDLTREEIARL
jgi:hypothetical protein